MNYTAILSPNRLTHAHSKPGVRVELTIHTTEPLPADIYERMATVVAAVDQLFDAIPEPEAVAS